MTHAVGSPWDQTYQVNRTQITLILNWSISTSLKSEAGSNFYSEIPLLVIQNYFAGLEELCPATRQFKESDFIGYRDSDGILVLPKEWNDEEI